MLNQERWNVAFVKLDALRKNIPRLITEERVAEYHAIVHTLQVESREENLVSFRIPEGELKQSLVAARRATRCHPGHATYSKDRYCDVHYFKRQVRHYGSTFCRFSVGPGRRRKTWTSGRITGRLATASLSGLLRRSMFHQRQ